MRRLVFQLIGGVTGVAEKRCAFGAQLGNAQDDRAIVEFAALAVSRERRFHDSLPQRTVLHRVRAGCPVVFCRGMENLPS